MRMERPRCTGAAADGAASEPQYARAVKKTDYQRPQRGQGVAGECIRDSGEIRVDSAIKANERTARLLGRGAKTVRYAVKDCTADAARNPVAVETSGNRGYKMRKEARITQIQA
eukprot:IDg15439t1